MNLLNLIEDTTTGYDNLRALMQAGQSGQDAVLNVGGETVTLDPMETRWMFGKYKAFNKAGRQEEFLNHLADPVKFDQHMKQLRQLMDKQKNFQGSVPGQRGVTGDTMPGQMEEDQAVEEIAMQDPNNMSAQTRGKLNWENMIKDYMGNKPYTEFEFGGDRPLTLYRTQVYAILKAFGSMKPQNKVNIILNTFGDKMATVEYLDKLRAKGLMPKKVPAYVAPGTEPVPPGQMSFPGMATPKIREADDQKKNSKTTELDGAVNPRVARAMQLARARQSAAGTDTEAMVADFVDQQEKDQAEFNKVKSVNQRQDDLLKQVTAVNQQQDREIDSLDSDNADLQNNLQQLQAVNADLAKKLADVGQRRADRQQEPQQAPAQTAATPAQPTAVAEPPLQQPTTTAQPAPAKKKKTTRKKSSATKVQRPQQDIPNNVLQFPSGGRSGQASDEVAAALQGVDMGNELATGTYGLKENTETLSVGDPVIISGNVEFNGKTGDVVGFGRDQHFVIVDLYNFGKHAFHASNVKYNDYADEEDTIDENQRMDKFNIAQPAPGGTNKQREAFLDARDRLFRQMQSATPGEKEAIRLKIAELEGQAQSQGVKIRETDELSRSGYNAIKSLSDWAEKMRVVRELQKDIALMSDPESKAAVQQRIGDLLKIGIKQGYVKEALNDKAMSVLRSLQQPAQSAPAAVDLNVPEPVGEPAMDLVAVRKRIAQLDELIRMKEQIDKLFVRAQNARGGIYPGLQSDIEDEELYGVPQSDKEYQILKDKYTKDLTALQKFIAMKKAVYREGQEALGESSALVKLKQARQALSQQGVAEAQQWQGNRGADQAQDTDHTMDEEEKKSWDYDLSNNPWRVTDADAITETDFEVVLQGPDNQQLNFIIRPIDFIEQQAQRFQIDSMDVRDLQTGKTKHVQSGKDMGSWIYIFDAIDEYFWQSPLLQKHLKKIIDYYMDAGEQGKNPDKMPGLGDRPIQTGIPADRFVKAHQDMKKATGQDLSEDAVDSKSWMAGIKAKYPTVKFAQNKTTMQIFAMVPGKGKVGTFDPRQQVTELEVADLVRPGAQTDTPPRRAYSIALQGSPGNDFMAEYAWDALSNVFPREYPAGTDAAERKVAEVAKRGSAIVKTGIASEDIADTYVAKLAAKRVPAQFWKIIGGELEEAQTDYQRRRQRERDVDAGRPVSRQPKNPQNDYFARRKKEKKHDMAEQQAVKESLRPGEYHAATVTLDNGDVRKFKVKSDEGFTDVIKNFYARQGRKVTNIDMDWSVQGDFYEQSIAEESQDDRNARIIAGEIEDAMAQGNEQVVKQKIKQLIGVGYTLDKNGKLQRMGMYEDQALQEEQDACYRKVKARYKVWPSAYASGALVQCRKKGADNWGEGGKKK